MSISQNFAFNNQLSHRYEVRHFNHGVAIYGTIPPSDWGALAEAWSKMGIKELRPDIAYYLKAVTVAVVDEAAASAWLSELGIRKDHPEWIRRGDIGTSALTIYACLKPDLDALWTGLRAAPIDASDFGRCRRLLTAFPTWDSRLGEVAQFCPEFTPLIPIWDRLTKAFDEGRFDEVSRDLAASRREFKHRGSEG